MKDSLLVLAAHPDDEVLGCGGSIAKLVERGMSAHIAFLSDGVGSRQDNGVIDSGVLRTRRDAASKAAEILGAQSIQFDDLPDNQLDTVPMLEITKRVEKLISEHQPKLVFTHHAGDLNVDHQRIHQAVMTACRPQAGSSVHSILCFEVPSSTEWSTPLSDHVFSPNWFIDISNTLQKKLMALDAYREEMRDWPHPRSKEGITYLARWRGATIGRDASEAFLLARHIG